MPPRGSWIILYDGVCGLCHGFVRFMIRHDPGAVFFFAPLQGAFAMELLAVHGGARAGGLDTVVLVTEYGLPAQALFFRSSAVARALGHLKWPWPLVLIFLALPAFARDVAYNVVAHLRYRVWGRREQCFTPEPRWRERFVGG